MAGKKGMKWRKKSEGAKPPSAQVVSSTNTSITIPNNTVVSPSIDTSELDEVIEKAKDTQIEEIKPEEISEGEEVKKLVRGQKPPSAPKQKESKNDLWIYVLLLVALWLGWISLSNQEIMSHLRILKEKILNVLLPNQEKI